MPKKSVDDEVRPKTFSQFCSRNQHNYLRYISGIEDGMVGPQQFGCFPVCVIQDVCPVRGGYLVTIRSYFNDGCDEKVWCRRFD